MYWKVFYDRDTLKEYCSYTLFGESEGEEQATINLTAYENGISPDQILTRIENRADNHPYTEQASEVVEAIRLIAKDEQKLMNLEGYLSRHFAKWLEIYADTPEGMASELKRFSQM